MIIFCVGIIFLSSVTQLILYFCNRLIDFLRRLSFIEKIANIFKCIFFTSWHCLLRFSFLIDRFLLNIFLLVSPFPFLKAPWTLQSLTLSFSTQICYHWVRLWVFWYLGCYHIQPLWFLTMSIAFARVWFCRWVLGEWECCVTWGGELIVWWLELACGERGKSHRERRFPWQVRNFCFWKRASLNKKY